MRSLFVLPLLLSMTSANLMNTILFKVLTHGMDPLSQSIWKSSLGTEFFESDSSSSGGPPGPVATYARDAFSDYIVQSMFTPQDSRIYGSSPAGPAFSHSSPNSASSNVITPSARDPSKDANLVNPYNSAPFAAEPSWSSPNTNVVSPAAPMPTDLVVANPSSPATTNTNDSGVSQTSFSSGNGGLLGGSSSHNVWVTPQNNFFQYFMWMRMLEMMELF